MLLQMNIKDVKLLRSALLKFLQFQVKNDNAIKVAYDDLQGVVSFLTSIDLGFIDKYGQFNIDVGNQNTIHTTIQCLSNVLKVGCTNDDVVSFDMVLSSVLIDLYDLL